jgi:hypothetical protein
MPGRDRVLIHLIAEALEKNPGLGANQLRINVTDPYGEKKGPSKRSKRPTKLSRRHFFKYLGLMIEDGLVEKLGGDAKGKKKNSI